MIHAKFLTITFIHPTDNDNMSSLWNGKSSKINYLGILAFEVDGGQKGAATPPALIVDTLLLLCDEDAAIEEDDEACDTEAAVAAATTDGCGVERRSFFDNISYAILICIAHHRPCLV